MILCTYDILFIIIFFLFIYMFIFKNEGFQSTTQNQIKDMIKEVYLADIEAIRNLSSIVKELQTGGLTIPGDLTVQGVINIKDNGTQLTRGDGNTLRIGTRTGWIDIGSKNDGWGHIYTDRQKFAFNKTVTDVATQPYNDYIKMNDKIEIQNNVTNLQKNVTDLQDTTNDYIWGIGMNNDIFRCKAPCSNGAWENIGGQLKNLTVGKTYIYGIGLDNSFWRCKKPCGNPAQWEKIQGILSNIHGE